MNKSKWIILLIILFSCIQETPELRERAPASFYSYKVITYGNNSIECRGYLDEDDAVGTLLETIPLSYNGQAPLRICGENIEDIESGVNNY
ncbi:MULTISPECIES: hypothetical protein [Halobacteriovorax]|uniref:Uncharacterized protein n=1 Tax=Halobacteriovorax vibrionivorans TaxID=2152716 RepID=A0ABY0IL56_9BACT|nr:MULTISPECIES: hypothetical protein [Halobacteriovorax]RZF22027.1 hypothetical protein DAY19_10110 [Halobacteriovorax vibrionivorans]TGD47109.1 hypothetical protein EP118_09425 [Halobacteriovorax sp. Y22]